MQQEERSKDGRDEDDEPDPFRLKKRRNSKKKGSLTSEDA